MYEVFDMANTHDQDTVEQLLAWMKDPMVDYTEKWSAVAAYDRHKANSLLQQEYVDRYSSEDFLEPIEWGFESVDADEHIWLGGVSFDAPRLSFDDSTLNDSAATLTWQAIDGGRFNLLNQPFTNHPRLWQLVQVAYENGLAGSNLTQTVKLETTGGEVDNGGEVYLDIAKPDTRNESFYNLAPASSQQQAAAAELQAWLKVQQGKPGNLTRYVLSKVVPDEEEFFNPTNFAVRVHPSSESTRDASGASDGAVLVFIQAHEHDLGSMPSPDTYRYLIPQGYSATLALAPKFVLRRFLEQTVQSLNPDGTIIIHPQLGVPEYAQFETGTLYVEEELKKTNMWTSDGWFDFWALDDLRFTNEVNAENRIQPFRIALTTPSGSNESIGLRVTWAGRQDVNFKSQLIKEDLVEDNAITFYWDVVWSFTIELNNKTNDLEIRASERIIKKKASPKFFGTRLKDVWEAQVVNHYENQWFHERVLSQIESAFRLAVKPLNAMRLNQLLFQSKTPVKLETLHMADAPVVFGQVSPSRTRFSLKLSRDGIEETDSVEAGQSLQLIVENTDKTPQSVTWSMEIAYGEVKGNTLGEVTGSGTTYAYRAPAVTDIVGNHLIVCLTATARFSGDSSAYVLKSLVKVYATPIAASAVARVLSTSKNFFLTVKGLGTGQVTGAIDSAAGTENEALVQDTSKAGFNWKYTSPSGTTETDDNEPGITDKPMAIGYRRLKFAQDGKATNVDTVVLYVAETLAILVTDQKVQGDYTLVTLKALWRVGKDQAVLPTDKLTWALPLNEGGVELQVQEPDTAVLKLPNALQCSYVAVEARVFDSTLALGNFRHQALIEQLQKDGLRRPGDGTKPDYVGVRLFPLPWVNIPEPESK